MNTMTKKQAYSILGLTIDASNEEVIEAHKYGTKLYQPSSPNANAEKLKEINAAYKFIMGDAHNAFNTSRRTYEKEERHYSTFEEGFKDPINYGYSERRNRFKNNLYIIYTLVKKRKWRKLKKQKESYTIAQFCSYGIMIRQALEVYLRETAPSLGINCKNKSTDEIISLIRANQSISNELKQTLYLAKDFGNEAAHLLDLDEIKYDLFEKCFSFYNTRFKFVLENHLKANPKPKKRYLCYLYNELNHFDIKRSLPSTILKANLMRQIVECIVDLWCFNECLPIVFNTNNKGEHENTYKKLEELRPLVNGRGNIIGETTFKNLHSLRMASKDIIHAPNNIQAINKTKKELSSLDKALSREVVEVTNFSSSQENTSHSSHNQKNPVTAAVLCFFLGNLGIHNFYVGKIGLGFLYLFTNGLFGIGILVDLFTMFTGNFKDANDKKMKKTKAPLVCLLMSVLALIAFAILQSYLNLDIKAWINTIIP